MLPSYVGIMINHYKDPYRKKKINRNPQATRHSIRSRLVHDLNWWNGVEWTLWRGWLFLPMKIYQEKHLMKSALNWCEVWWFGLENHPPFSQADDLYRFKYFMCSAGPRLLIGPTISPWQRDTTNLVLSGILIRLCDLIEDGLEHRREHGVFNLVSAGLHVDRLVRGWKVPRCVVGRAKRLSRGWSCRKKKLKVKYTDAQKDRVSNLLQVFCYFRSTYEVLIDADEHLSTLLGPADLLAHLKALVDLVSPMGVSDQVLGLLANGQLAEAGDARQVEKEEWRHLRNHQTRTCWPWPKMLHQVSPWRSNNSSCARSHVRLATGG